MRTNRTPNEWADWCIARNRIADELKKVLWGVYDRGIATSINHAFKKARRRTPQKARTLALLSERRFPPPWSVEDIGAAFVVKDGA
jgi:hypothetical protein